MSKKVFLGDTQLAVSSELAAYGKLDEANTWTGANTFNATITCNALTSTGAIGGASFKAGDRTVLEVASGNSINATVDNLQAGYISSTGTLSVGSPGHSPVSEVANIYGPLMAYNVTVSTELKANLITTSQISAKNITVSTDIKAQTISADFLMVDKNSNSQYALTVSSDGTRVRGALDVDSITVNQSAMFKSGVTVTGGTLYVDSIIATQESSFNGGIYASYLTAPGGATLGYLEVASQLRASQIVAKGSLIVGTDNNQGSLEVNGNLTVTKHMGVSSAEIPDLTAGAIVVSDSVTFGIGGGGSTLAYGRNGSLVVDGPTYFKDVTYFEEQVNAPSMDVQNSLSTKKLTVPVNGSAKLDCPTKIADLTVGTDLTVKYNAVIANDMTVGGKLYVGGNDCSGQAGFTSDGDSVFTHKVTIGNPDCAGSGMSGLFVYAATDLTSLTVYGTAAFIGGATFGGGIITDSITTTGTLALTGNVSISKGLTVTNAATFNGGIKTRSIRSLDGTSLFSVVDYKGFDISGVYRLLSYGGNTPFLVANNGEWGDGTITLDVTTAKAGTFIENGTELEDKYAQLIGTNTWSGDNKFTGMLEVGSAVITHPQVRKLDFISSDMSGDAMGGIDINNNNKLRIWHDYGIVMDTATTFNSGTTFGSSVTVSGASTFDSTVRINGSNTTTYAELSGSEFKLYNGSLNVSSTLYAERDTVRVGGNMIASKVSIGAPWDTGTANRPYMVAAFRAVTGGTGSTQSALHIYPGTTLTVSSDETSTGNTSIKGTLSVDKAATFTSGVTMSSTLNAAGKVTATAGMEVTGTTKFKSGLTVSGGSSTFTTPVTVNADLTANKLTASRVAVCGILSMAPQPGGAYLTALQVASQPITAVYPGVDLRVLSDEYGKGDVLVQGRFRFMSGYNVSGTSGLANAKHNDYAEHNTPSLWVDSTTAEDKQLRIGAPKTICLDCTSDDGSEVSVNVGLHNSNTYFKVLGPAVYDNSQTSFYGKVYNTGDVSFSGTATFDTSPTVNGNLTVTGKITSGNADVLKVVTLTQAQYNALATKDANTLYKVQ